MLGLTNWLKDNIIGVVFVLLGGGLIGSHFVGGDSAPVTVDSPHVELPPSSSTRWDNPISPRAVRLVYDQGGKAWGSGCELDGGGYLSVKHVTDNGGTIIGPTDAVTKDNGPSDWSFIGVDPMDLNADDFPEIRAGEEYEIHGFVARDRRGQIVPGVAYIEDNTPPFWWLELRDSFEDQFGRKIEAEGVLGGFSGSCVLNSEGRVVGAVHANGFSKIEGTTNTWALFVPARAAVLEAQGKVKYTAPTSFAPNPLMPRIELGWRRTDPTN